MGSVVGWSRGLLFVCILSSSAGPPPPALSRSSSMTVITPFPCAAEQKKQKTGSEPAKASWRTWLTRPRSCSTRRLSRCSPPWRRSSRTSRACRRQARRRGQGCRWEKRKNRAREREREQEKQEQEGRVLQTKGSVLFLLVHLVCWLVFDYCVVFIDDGILFLLFFFVFRWFFFFFKVMFLVPRRVIRLHVCVSYWCIYDLGVFLNYFIEVLSDGWRYYIPGIHFIFFFFTYLRHMVVSVYRCCLINLSTTGIADAAVERDFRRRAQEDCMSFQQREEDKVISIDFGRLATPFAALYVS